MKAKSELNLNAARQNGTDYSGQRFSVISIANGSHLTDCNFRGIHATKGCLGAGKRPSVYTGCVFDGSTLKGDGLDPGRATFVSCSFLDVKLSHLNFMDAEFVDCVFSGTLESVTFSADPWARDAELGRTVNRYEGNDFTAARMQDVDFRGGIGLGLQRLPEGGDYLVVRDAAAVLKAAVQEIETWADTDEREEALSTIDTLEFDVQGGQRDLFMDTAFVTDGLSPEAAGRLLAVFRRS
ncbi:hypothetical protein HD597_003786 [Nonomuraea thailandensis]|uniref:Pentapeptide repeat-containing protein n=1 Tax=Nonomuraea thailandensis TaxID=1188745 RepID=A0A9X2GD73_9ACTN|nr:hypothetical protein [Nonomuraea thailandensis]MCP2356766.1 hypothetical protein [Nonomuraea thailandensis]